MIDLQWTTVHEGTTAFLRGSSIGVLRDYSALSFEIERIDLLSDKNITFLRVLAVDNSTFHL